MRLQDIDLDRLTPQFMENDPCVKAMNAVLEPVIKELANKMSSLSIWNDLRSLSDEELDLLAHEFDIPWYNNTYAREKKISIIENNVKLMKRLGTPYTFKQVIQDIFGSCELKEAGIHYEGEPYHFQIMVAQGESLDKVSYDRLQYLMNKVKRASCRLEKIMSIYNSTMQEQHAMRVQDTVIDRIPTAINGYLNYKR